MWTHRMINDVFSKCIATRINLSPINVTYNRSNWFRSLQSWDFVQNWGRVLHLFGTIFLVFSNGVRKLFAAHTDRRWSSSAITIPRYSTLGRGWLSFQPTWSFWQTGQTFFQLKSYHMRLCAKCLDCCLSIPVCEVERRDGNTCHSLKLERVKIR